MSAPARQGIPREPSQPGATTKYGARNCIEAEVTAIKKGDMMCLVNLHVPADCAMSSVLTVDSLEDLGLKEGDKVNE